MKKKWRFFLITFLAFCTSFSQVNKSNSTGGTVNGSSIVQTIEFSASDFGSSPSIQDLNISFNWSGGTSPYLFDNGVELTSPEGTKVVLVNDIQGAHTGDNTQQATYQNNSFQDFGPLVTVFDDEATNSASGTVVPATGSWKPQNPLSAFDGENPVGTWSISITDGKNNGWGDSLDWSEISITIDTGASSPPVSPTTLSAGDLAFLALNFDIPRSFSFVLLKDISATTTITFTDMGWSDTGTFLDQPFGDGSYIWTPGQAVSAGTVVTISYPNTATIGTMSLDYAPTIPGTSTVISALLSSGGDQMFAFQGNRSNPTFIAGIHSEETISTTTDANWSNTGVSITNNTQPSDLPNQLTNGTNAIRLHVSGSERDNWKYVGTTTSGTQEQLLEAINDLSNWTSNDGSSFGAYTGTFTVSSGPSLPTVITTAASSIMTTSASLGGNVTADGGDGVTERGIVWGTITNPTTDDNKVQIGTGVGVFSNTINSLPAGTRIYVRAYAINSVGTAYGSTIDFETAKLSPTITFNNVTKTYGDANFNLNATSNSGGAISYAIIGSANGTSLSGTNNENVTLGNAATVTIRATVTENGTYTSGTKDISLEIRKKTITINAEAKSKVYGSSDPEFTYQLIGDLESGDAITGSLIREVGENVGAYAINQGSVTAGTNYAITYNSANLTITKKAITITAEAKSKIYGSSDPEFTYQLVGDLESGDAITGSFTRETGEHVGTYAINQGSVTAGTNYAITYNSANLTITKKGITITAEAKSKVYGLSDPEFTYQLTGDLESGDAITGSFTRESGEHVGTYAINQGSVTAGTNYAITYNSANLTITKKGITITAEAKSKVYGSSDPEFTYQLTGDLESGDAITGSFTRESGENVGTYAINQGSITAGTNYAITYNSANLTITKKGITITAEAKSKIYGSSDPEFTYQLIGDLESGDAITGSLIREVGENVGTYAINQGSITAGTNYAITYNSAHLTITKKAITINAEAKSKIYGSSDPEFTYQLIGDLESGDAITGSFTRESGENVGTYAINQGSITAGNNYAITYNSANLTITKKAITITAEAKSKVYGASDPEFTYQLIGDLESGDTITGSLTREVGENVGTYAIKQGSITAGNNYAITYNSANLTITKKGITITAEAKSKVYGSSDPEFTYQLTGDLESGDTITGSFTRESGENVGTYAINQGSVTAGTNYAITYNSANLTITKKGITITAEAKSKVYGSSDPEFTYQLVGDLESGDTITGSFTRESGEHVGTYAINQGSVTAGTNYAITYNSANLTITKKAITINAEAKSKIYGSSDPEFTYQLTRDLESGDAITGSFTRESGEHVGTYVINQGSITAGNNYAITYNSANLTITKKAITITAEAKSKIYGASDPEFTYQLVGDLESGDTITGSFTRESGENVGTYAINQGSVTAGTNYAITYNSANLTITKKAITITAEAKSKVYGSSDPEFTYQLTGDLESGDAITGSLTREVGENVGTYAINQGSATAGTNYAITYNSANLTITKKAITITAEAKSKIYGSSDPEFTYQLVGDLESGDAITGSFTRESGEHVGAYVINQGSITAGTNYAITYNSANLTITKKTITITAEAKSKIYGSSDPEFTYQLVGDLESGDAITGSFTRESGENVGTYVINQGSITAGNNYAITYNSENLTITKKAITITAEAKSKIYGASDPEFTYQLVGDLESGDAITGSLIREVGEHVGAYAINQGSVTAGTNYAITYNSANLTITKKGITITAEAKSKTYGSSDPEFTYQLTGDLESGDAITGSLTREVGENVGTYVINQGSITAGNNYAITYNSENLTITKKAITITAEAKSKIYGASDPEFTYQLTGDLESGDTITGSFTRESGEHVGTYAINQGSVTAGTNYAITYNSANLTITKKGITITAEAKNKVYGSSDPEFTYQLTGDLESGDAITGSLTREVGENVGTYTINQGSVTAGTNYAITYNSANLTIIAAKPKVLTKKAVVITLIKATLQGEILSEGGGTVVERGFVWSTKPNPTLDDHKIVNKSSNAILENQINNLNSNKTYYFRTFATNESGTTLGNEESFTTAVLGVEDNIIKDLKYYPNPVVSKLTISGGVPIDKIEVYNAIGQRVLLEKSNALQVNVNLEGMKNGIYYVKIYAENKIKTISVIKK